MKKQSSLIKNIWQTYSKWILLAILVRLILMPFFTHSDLLSVYQRANLILESGKPFSIFSINGLHALFLFLIKPFLINVAWPPKEIVSLEFANWYNFISSPNIFRTLFLFKLPYFIFEVLGFITLANLLKNKPYQKKALLFWLFNPVIIFSTYIFGRFDMIAIFFVLGALYLFKKHKLYFSIAVLAIAAILRYYPLFFVPVFLLMSRQNNRLKLSGTFMLSASFLFVLNYLLKIDLEPAKKIIGMVSPSYFPFTFKIHILSNDVIYIFVVSVTLLLIYAYLNIKPSFDNLLKMSLALLMTFFAFSYFHPHYFIWVVPFVALLIYDQKIIGLYWLQVVAWSVFILKWGNDLTTSLLMPLSPLFFKHIMLFENTKNVNILTGSARSVFTAIAIALIILLIIKRKEQKVATD